MRAIRIIMYEMDTQEDMDWQLGHSLPDGNKSVPNGTITINTIKPSDMIQGAYEWALLRRYIHEMLDWHVEEPS